MELDLLEARLAILDDSVDCFVICESPFTHSGKPKPLYYEENKKLFKAWSHKIFHYVIPQDDEELWKQARESSLVTSPYYLRDYYEKESIKKALIAAGIKNEDIAYVSDCDEIWKPKEIRNEIYKLKQEMYAYYFNNKSSEKWAGTFVGKWKTLYSECFNNLRANCKNYLEDGGWHFTNLGGETYLRKKLEAYSAQEFNTPYIKSLLETRVQNNQDYLGRGFTFTEDYNIPTYLLDNRIKYEQFFRRFDNHSSI